MACAIEQMLTDSYKFHQTIVTLAKNCTIFLVLSDHIGYLVLNDVSVQQQKCIIIFFVLAVVNLLREQV